MKSQKAKRELTSMKFLILMEARWLYATGKKPIENKRRGERESE